MQKVRSRTYQLAQAFKALGNTVEQEKALAEFNRVRSVAGTAPGRGAAGKAGRHPTGRRQAAEMSVKRIIAARISRGGHGVSLAEIAKISRRDRRGRREHAGHDRACRHPDPLLRQTRSCPASSCDLGDLCERSQAVSARDTRRPLRETS